MQAPIPHLASRLISLTAFTVVGGLLVGSGLSQGFVGRSLLGIGVVVLGVFAFLQPLLFDVPLRMVLTPPAALAIGSRRLRMAVSMLALALVLASLVLSMLRL